MSIDYSRYNCQIALPGFGEAAQQLLQQAKVLVVGAGGLGCPALQYLVGAGVGTIGIADYDTISVSNLHRQILYSPEDAGKQKVAVAVERLQKQNPDIRLVPHELKITSSNALDIISKYDIVVDGTDNFETRYLLNDTAVLTGKPLIYGAIYQFEGQVAVWNIRNSDGTYSPNYRDLYPQVDATQVPNCAEGGVIPTLAGIIGCIQANEAIKLITKMGELLSGKLLLFDAQTLQGRTIKIGTVTKTKIQSLAETSTVPTITAAELKKSIKEYELIDVRSEREHDLFDIGGKNIPADEIEDNIEYFNSNSAKVLYCSSGKRSAEVVKLIKNKYPQAKVFSLEDGLGLWGD